MERKWKKNVAARQSRHKRRCGISMRGHSGYPMKKSAIEKRDPAREQHGKASLKKTLLLHHHFWREEKDDNDATTHAGELK